MEQPMVIDADRLRDYQNEGLITPCRVVIQRSLSLPPGSSSKRSLFRDNNEMKRDAECISDAESDLGPMSPLALTDHSSCDSSPGRQFVSPLATPEKSPTIALTRWDRLTPRSIRSNFNESISPFSTLKKVTRSARFSPRRVLSLSPNSKSSQSSRNTRAENILTSPDSADETLMPEEIIPETPGKESDFDDQQSYVAETPQKEEYNEYRLITPLGSVCKNIPIPRIHRRKSLSSLELDECASPEIKKCPFKRHQEDLLSFSNIKYQKTDEMSSVPRARAALFQDSNKNEGTQDKGFTLNPKSFYGSNTKFNKSVGVKWREPQPDHKKRRSLPSHTSISRRSGKRSRKGEINCGVRHGIKKPKPKRQSLQNNGTKLGKQADNTNNKNTDAKENVNPKAENIKNNLVSEEIDSNKKFFKFKIDQSAVGKVTNNIKLKTALNQNEKNTEPPAKKAKLDSVAFDATDLSVDEPAIEKSLEQNKVDNILKILENDWADDDYDSLEFTQTDHSKVQTLSPKKSNVMLKDLTMSPASELSNMASTMYIEDFSITTESLTNENHNNDNSMKISTEKFYPLFAKNYSSDLANEASNPKKRKRSTAWQLSTKYGNAVNQYQIDAGQKVFGATQCNECGIIYHIGDPDDENAHLNYHNSFKTLKFQGWKNERVIFKDSYSSSRIILVEPKDSNLYWKKVTDILEIVDRDLGLSDMKLSFYRDKKVYMYVRDKIILGVLVAEDVKSAFRMIPELIELNCCTSDSTPVKCGVNVVWTAMSHRRQGIATKLVDTLRANYYYGYIMSIDDLAFSTPTPSGKGFAEKYTKTRNFKVY